MPQGRYKSHARTLYELRAEFLSDINRRLDHLDQQLKIMRPSAAEASRITRARQELLAMFDYWSQIDLEGTPQ